MAFGSNYSALSIGGSNDAVVISHSHGASVASGGNHTHSGSANSNGAHTHSTTVTSAGEDGIGKNMPAYISVNIWRRTA